MTDRTGDVTAFCAGAEAVAFVDASALELGTIVTGLDKATAMRRFDVRCADDTLASGAQGFGHLWLALLSWRWLGRIVLLPGVQQVTKVVYRGSLVVGPALRWMFSATPSARTGL